MSDISLKLLCVKTGFIVIGNLKCQEICIILNQSTWKNCKQKNCKVFVEMVEKNERLETKLPLNFVFVI